MSSHRLILTFYFTACTWTLFAAVRGQGAAEFSGDSGSGTTDQEDVYCPGYQPGNPGIASTMEGCRTEKLGVVDHVLAFGIDQKAPNWTTCGIPKLPGEK